MARRPAGRSLRDLVDADAPLPPGRAASVMVAVARHVERVEASGRDAGELVADEVVLHADGSVELRRTPVPSPTTPGVPEDGPAMGTAGGAATGRLLFELLVGRPPLGREDAFEPAIVSAFEPATCSLLARSLSESPGQWPRAAEWRRALEAETRGLAPPLPPREQASIRRRRLLVALGLVVLVTATVVVLVLAPTWWASVSP